MEKIQLKPIKKEITTQDKVYNQMKRAILFGGFPSEEIFTEIQLAEQLDTSRTPVRAAIQDLVKEGLLVWIPRKGVTVRKISPEEEDEIFLLRTTIEVQVVKNIIKVVKSPKQLEGLRAIVREQEQAVKNDDAVKFIELDHEFHILLTQLANFSIMEQVLQNLHNLTQLIGLKAVKEQGRAEKVLNEHNLIIQALEEKNAELAEQSIMEHLQNTKETLKNIDIT